MSRTLTFQDMMDDISESLKEADGKHITQVYNSICLSQVFYKGYSVWEENGTEYEHRNPLLK